MVCLGPGLGEREQALKSLSDCAQILRQFSITKATVEDGMSRG
jgi:hypothetical protein